jgi:hypothetical protein
LVLLVLAIIVTVFLYRNIADRHPGYTVDININPKMQPGNSRVGFGKVPITPEILIHGMI